jgi:hypothetical protein
MVRHVLLIVGLGLLGVLAAASIGYASYLVSRDDVGLPVTKLEQAPRDVVPVQARTQTQTATVEDRTTRSGTNRTTTVDDNSGSGRGGDDNSGKGSSGSGSGSSGKGSSGSGSGSSGKGSGGDFDDD